MDIKTAKLLLQQIRQVKQAGEGESPNFSWLARNMPTSLADVTPDLGLSTVDPVARLENAKMQSAAKSQILNTMLLGGGLGAAFRGVTGLSNLLGESKPTASPRRVVELPVPYADKPTAKKSVKEKRAGDEDSTVPYGLSYYMPGMLLGGGLAVAGGWKGVDALIDRQRHKQETESLDEAKQEYEDALLGSYKRAVDGALDKAFKTYEKRAYSLSDLTGGLTGAGLTYAAASLPAGYMVVNDMMKKNSKRALLEKALKERARRQAIMQPPEIYAIPKPPAEESE